MSKQIYYDKSNIKKLMRYIGGFSILTILLFSSFYYFKLIELIGYLIFLASYPFLITLPILILYRKLKTNIPAIEITKDYISLMNFNVLSIMNIDKIHYNDILHMGVDISKNEETKMELLSITLKDKRSINYNLNQHSLSVEDLIEMIYEVNPGVKINNYGFFEYN
jgi:hypothetical protein